MFDPDDFHWEWNKENYKRIHDVVVPCLQLLALLLVYGIAIEGMINGAFG